MNTACTGLRAFSRLATDGSGILALSRRAALLCTVLLATLVLQISGGRADTGIVAGAKGQADYPDYERISSMTAPEVSAAGFFVLFSVTRDICLKLEAGDNDLAALAPRGFSIARGDIHSFGFEGKQKRAWWAISVTGDGEQDDAAQHPYWYVTFGEDGQVEECSLTWVVDAAGVEDTVRQHIIHWLYVGAPQLFRAIMVEPRFAGLYSPLQPDLIQLARPCPVGWCQVTINPLLVSDSWHLSATFLLNGAAR